ncbi:MAG: phytanoyl-CoA dioxygenase family protein [Phycisphaerales bacterium]|nr:phytanoyl-CoA dioxygenase family protein [Phycisphaerales bacterium]
MTASILSSPSDTSKASTERTPVSVEQYTRFKRDGFTVFRGLVSPAEVEELRQHTEDLMAGKLPEQQNQVMATRDLSKDFGVTTQKLEAPATTSIPGGKSPVFSADSHAPSQARITRALHAACPCAGCTGSAHRPGCAGAPDHAFPQAARQAWPGWHQDSYYIPTRPDTLCGAWIAIDACDEQNGAMWFAKSSGNEPIYPPCPEISYGFGDKLVNDITYVKGVSDPVDKNNALSAVAESSMISAGRC